MSEEKYNLPSNFVTIEIFERARVFYPIKVV